MQDMYITRSQAFLFLLVFNFQFGWLEDTDEAASTHCTVSATAELTYS